MLIGLIILAAFVVTVVAVAVIAARLPKRDGDNVCPTGHK